MEFTWQELKLIAFYLRIILILSIFIFCVFYFLLPKFSTWVDKTTIYKYYQFQKLTEEELKKQVPMTKGESFFYFSGLFLIMLHFVAQILIHFFPDFLSKELIEMILSKSYPTLGFFWNRGSMFSHIQRRKKFLLEQRASIFEKKGNFGRLFRLTETAKSVGLGVAAIVGFFAAGSQIYDLPVGLPMKQTVRLARGHITIPELGKSFEDPLLYAEELLELERNISIQKGKLMMVHPERYYAPEGGNSCKEIVDLKNNFKQKWDPEFDVPKGNEKKD